MDGKAVTDLVGRELTGILVQQFRVEPYPVEREETYGTPGQQYSKENCTQFVGYFWVRPGK